MGSISKTIVSVVSVLSDMQSAIKVATGKLGLQPGAAFQARVAQLAELVKAHKLVSLEPPDINIHSSPRTRPPVHIYVIKLACGSYVRNVGRVLFFCRCMCGSLHKLVKST